MSEYSTENLVYHVVNSFYPNVMLLSSFGTPESAILIHMVARYFHDKVPIVHVHGSGDIGNEEEVRRIQECVARQYDADIHRTNSLNEYVRDNKVDACVTGLRREHETDQKKALMIDRSGYNYPHNLIKINPLIDWSGDEVWSYIEENNIPKETTCFFRGE